VKNYLCATDLCLLIFESTDIGTITMLAKSVNLENACILARSGGEIKGYS